MKSAADDERAIPQIRNELTGITPEPESTAKHVGRKAITAASLGATGYLAYKMSGHLSGLESFGWQLTEMTAGAILAARSRVRYMKNRLGK